MNMQQLGNINPQSTPQNPPSLNTPAPTTEQHQPQPDQGARQDIPSITPGIMPATPEPQHAR